MDAAQGGVGRILQRWTVGRSVTDTVRGADCIDCATFVEVNAAQRSCALKDN
jgi:hypothetical protein